MRTIICQNYDELSDHGAKLIASQIILKPDSVLGFATGSTPVGIYSRLTDMFKRGEISFKDITTFNLDEYYPIDPSNEQSYHYFMMHNLFNNIDIDKNNIHIPNGRASDTEKECADYEALIEKHGGIDLQLLGIGQNGHIGFNEPDATLETGTHLTALTESTINANSRFFKSSGEVPRNALTMGIATILKSRKIILAACGKNKHDAVAALLTDEIDTQIPATMLKVHPDVVLICDRDAYER